MSLITPVKYTFGVLFLTSFHSVKNHINLSLEHHFRNDERSEFAEGKNQNSLELIFYQGAFSRHIFPIRENVSCSYWSSVQRLSVHSVLGNPRRGSRLAVSFIPDFRLLSNGKPHPPTRRHRCGPEGCDVDTLPSTFTFTPDSESSPNALPCPCYNSFLSGRGRTPSSRFHTAHYRLKKSSIVFIYIDYYINNIK